MQMRSALHPATYDSGRAGVVTLTSFSCHVSQVPLRQGIDGLCPCPQNQNDYEIGYTRPMLTTPSRAVAGPLCKTRQTRQLSIAFQSKMCKEVGAVSHSAGPETQTMIGSTGVHRVTAVLTLRLLLSMYFGGF